jgi:PAS domain-containing protein
MPVDNLDDLLRLVASPAYFFDRDSHQIIACNQQFATLMEYEIKELLTMPVEQLRPPEEIPLLARALAASPPEGAVEWRYRTRSGIIQFVQLIYRNSMYIDKASGLNRNVRMVVISKWDTIPVKSADALFGS